MRSTPPYSIRFATPDDLPSVEWLLQVALLPIEGVEEQFEASYAVALASDGDVIAAAGIELYGSIGLLRSVVVHPICQRRGVGEAVVRERLAWGEAEGVQTLYLLTTTAAAYFPRFGFKPVSRDDAPRELRQSVEFSVCPESAVLMKLPLKRDSATQH